ncbi:uncharacterized protein LOC134718852 [Mytilus trossulus]|uniref:uncharacterized protein LOC134718852 n=1 Tax=Mytilus trossulus TaxID=6551 RepID=UPI0030055981
MVTGVDGLSGISAVRHVTVEFRIEIGNVMSLNHPMEEFTAKEHSKRVVLVTTSIVKLIGNGGHGKNGKFAILPVETELNTEDENVTALRRILMDLNVWDLILTSNHAIKGYVQCVRDQQ